jgi:curved DNA-binding protein CbpA
MGNNVSLAAGGIPEAHVRIYRNLLQIQSPATRVQMIETLMSGQEYVGSAKASGLYGPLLGYVAACRRGDPAVLPGESGRAQHLQVQRTGGAPQQRAQAPVGRTENTLVKRGANADQHTKAISYFTFCLQTLGLQEEVALNEEVLKKAYKAASMKAHPDKGGTEEAFDAVTRAYAYLGDILRRVRGGRDKLVNLDEETPETVNRGRNEVAQEWKMEEPVRLNPKNLDMNAFNRLFEETRMPDPDDDGYGDWLKNGGNEAQQGGSSKKFSGQFNRDIFNSAFEDELRSRSGRPTNQLSVRQPEALVMAPGMGVELGRDKAESYTAANMKGFMYTDLKNAYTTDSTFSHAVADVRVEARSYDGMRAERKAAPAPLTAAEMAAVQEGERLFALRQQQQAARIAEEDRRISDHFSRVKQRVITDGKPVDQSGALQGGQSQRQIQNGPSRVNYALTNH